jgi:hypothetical protein
VREDRVYDSSIDDGEQGLTEGEFKDFTDNILAQFRVAEERGLVETEVMIWSTIDHSEGFPGPVRVYVIGKRELNSKELIEKRYQDKVQVLADKVKISYYDASSLQKLLDSNKVSLKG